MGRLTEIDVCGHWRLKGLPWKNLYEGTPITRETYEALYGALCKLLDYEETGLTPEEIEMRTYCTIGTPCEFQSSEIRKDGWIPVEERLPTEEEQKKDDGDFEITIWNEYKQGKPFVSRGYFNGREFELQNKDYSTFAEVIAWQPLPEPYKGGQNET